MSDNSCISPAFQYPCGTCNYKINAYYMCGLILERMLDKGLFI